MKISYAINEEWEYSTSILKAKRLVDKKFLLIMDDHLFTSSIIKGILGAEGDLVVAIDSDPRYADVGERAQYDKRHIY